MILFSPEGTGNKRTRPRGHRKPSVRVFLTAFGAHGTSWSRWEGAFLWSSAAGTWNTHTVGSCWVDFHKNVLRLMISTPRSWAGGWAGCTGFMMCYGVTDKAELAALSPSPSGRLGYRWTPFPLYPSSLGHPFQPVFWLSFWTKLCLTVFWCWDTKILKDI